MDDEFWEAFGGLAIAFAVIALGAIITMIVIGGLDALRAKPEALATPNMDRVYYTQWGGIYCGNMAYTECGVRLWNCSDERVYVCLHGVAYKDIRDEKPAAP